MNYRRLLFKAIFPLLFYGAAFCILTFPLMARFSTHFFAEGQLDGLQNVWNLWWVDKAVTQLHQSPWQTPYLYYPFGVTLLGHTLNPFNGFLAVFLLKFLTLVQAYNCIVIFSFVAGGVSAFLLAHYFSKSYWGSIAAGFIFTFSSYHFVHMGGGHLQLVALEWIPLFVLYAHRVITQPKMANALLSALFLFLVILCDYYYFFYCVLIFFCMVIWYAMRTRSLFFFKKDHLFALIAFGVTALATAGPMVFSLILINRRDPFLGVHPPGFFSADLFSFIIHGNFWRFNEATRFYWSRVPFYFPEYSLHLGLVVIFMLCYVWWRRKKIDGAPLGFWYFSLIFFFILSLGPVLHAGGKAVTFIKMPYALLQAMVPALKLSGVPVRMAVMVVLSASVIFAIGCKGLFGRLPHRRYFIALFLTVLFIEHLPRPMSSFRVEIPGYINILRDMPGEDGVFDGVHRKVFALYFQTVHQKPMAFGYVSRVPRSVQEKSMKIIQAIAAKDYGRLYHRYKIRYLIAPATIEIKSERLPIQLLYKDSSVRLYDLGAGA